MKIPALVTTVYFAIATVPSPATSQARPAPSLLAKTAIVQFLSTLIHCESSKEEIEEAIQPLLIQISYANDRARDEVLADLATYRFEESNREILLCALSNRYASSKTFAKSFLAGSKDCSARFGKAEICSSDRERQDLVTEVKRLAKSAPCRVEP